MRAEVTRNIFAAGMLATSALGGLAIDHGLDDLTPVQAQLRDSRLIIAYLDAVRLAGSSLDHTVSVGDQTYVIRTSQPDYNRLLQLVGKTQSVIISSGKDSRLATDLGRSPISGVAQVKTKIEEEISILDKRVNRDHWLIGGGISTLGLSVISMLAWGRAFLQRRKRAFYRSMREHAF